LAINSLVKAFSLRRAESEAIFSKKLLKAFPSSGIKFIENNTTVGPAVSEPTIEMVTPGWQESPNPLLDNQIVGNVIRINGIDFDTILPENN